MQATRTEGYFAARWHSCEPPFPGETRTNRRSKRKPWRPNSSVSGLSGRRPLTGYKKSLWRRAKGVSKWDGDGEGERETHLLNLETRMLALPMPPPQPDRKNDAYQSEDNLVRAQRGHTEACEREASRRGEENESTTEQCGAWLDGLDRVWVFLRIVLKCKRARKRERPQVILVLPTSTSTCNRSPLFPRSSRALMAKKAANKGKQPADRAASPAEPGPSPPSLTPPASASAYHVPRHTALGGVEDAPVVLTAREPAAKVNNASLTELKNALDDVVKEVSRRSRTGGRPSSCLDWTLEGVHVQEGFRADPPIRRPCSTSASRRTASPARMCTKTFAWLWDGRAWQWPQRQGTTAT